MNRAAMFAVIAGFAALALSGGGGGSGGSGGQPGDDRMNFKLAKDLRDLPRTPGERGAPHGTRPWSQIAGITLHQTGTRDFSPNHSGLDHVPAHALVHRDGSVSLLHHPEKYIYHGNALNAGTIGIEVAARAAGTEGDPSTFWRSKDEKAAGKTYESLVAEATDAQLSALEQLIRYYYNLAKENGGEINGLWGHIQGASDRGSDPGSRIWSVAERLTPALGLKDRRDMTLGSGHPIPMSWRKDVAIA